MITVHDADLNPFELIIVLDRLHKAGKKYADIYKGNNCIWVALGNINHYYIFRDGKLADIQVD